MIRSVSSHATTALPSPDLASKIEARIATFHAPLAPLSEAPFVVNTTVVELDDDYTAYVAADERSFYLCVEPEHLDEALWYGPISL